MGSRGHLFSRAATVLATLGVAFAALAPASHAARPPRPLRAPAGLAFYDPPSHLAPGRHGDVIWSRPIGGDVALPSAARNLLVLYRSTAPNGKPIAVSGTIAIPRGKPPKGGWPVISWAHGTTGSADVCAPSRDSATSPAHPYIAYVNPVLDDWVKHGYAVLRTDYQGLGTPGPHPYLIGESEGRGVIDIVRAARELVPQIGKRWAIAGHSQGGHAALWAAADAQGWAPELRLVGTVAFAPASHVDALVRLASTLTSPGGLSGLGALLAAGAATASPAVNLNQLLSDRALALVPQIEQTCLAQLGQSSSFGGLSPSQLLRPGANTIPFDNVVVANDPGHLKIAARTLIVQGDADTTVLPMFTTSLVSELQGLGDPVEYQVFKGVDHGGIVSAAEAAATTWLAGRFAG